MDKVLCFTDEYSDIEVALQEKNRIIIHLLEIKLLLI